MARCQSLDILHQIKLNGEMEDIESSESDTDANDFPIQETPVFKKEDSANTEFLENNSNEKQISIGPVLSLKCLHEESINEENGSENYSKTKIEFIDINDVPELSIQNDKEDKEVSTQKGKEEHPHLIPLPINGDCNVLYKLMTLSESSVPARNNWEGGHNFKIKIDCSVQSKGEHVIFEEAQNKLYITKDHPFKVLVSADNVPEGAMIRVVAIFCMVEHSYKVVQRCPTHAQQDFSKGVVYFEHFVQCFSDAAVYEKNPQTGKLSVSVLYKKPQEGEKYSAYLFKLTCFSSCSGGINRRPFMLIFTLEKDGISLGRQILNAKVCACPMRDYKKDNTRSKIDSISNFKESSEESSEFNSERNSNLIPILPKPKQKVYSIAVKDPDLYLFLEQMKTFYEKGASQIISD